MTDKENRNDSENSHSIIIDDVNVAECKMLCESYECALHYIELCDGDNVIIFGKNCRDNECYFKQLKRSEDYEKSLKDELAREKQKNEELETQITDLEDKLDNLEFERDEFEDNVKDMNYITDTLQDRLITKDETDIHITTFKNRIDNFVKKHDAYKQALKEINRIVTEENHLDYLGPYEKDDIMEILQKAKEVLDE